MLYNRTAKLNLSELSLYSPSNNDIIGKRNLTSRQKSSKEFNKWFFVYLYNEKYLLVLKYRK
jgi:hypothetical protein